MQFKCIFNDKSRSKCCFEWHFEWHQNIVKNRILNSICRKRPFLFHKQDHFVSFSLYSLPWIGCCMIIALNFCIVSAKLSNFGCDRKPPWDIQAGTTFRYPICCGAGLSAGVLLQIHSLQHETWIKYSKSMFKTEPWLSEIVLKSSEELLTLRATPMNWTEPSLITYSLEPQQSGRQRRPFA